MPIELPSIDTAIKSVLSEVNGPIDVNDFYKKVLEIRPSSSKNPTGSIRNNLRMNFDGESIAFLNKKTIIPLRVAMPGVRFRILISEMEANRRVLVIKPSFSGFIYIREDPKNCMLVDEQGDPLPVKIVPIKQHAKGLLGEFDYTVNTYDLSSWNKINTAKPNDNILVTIESWEPKRFRLELEPKRERRSHSDEIASKNKELADILFNMLETSASEQIYIKESIITAYLRLSDPKGYPGDHWMDVLGKDPRMKADDFSITYPERRSMLEAFIDRTPTVTKQKITPQQSNQVYRFKAALKYRPNIWRIIEIQGNQTLVNFDDILREAFNHDSSDHLGGFWRQVRRGQTNRFRETDLGDVDPTGHGTGAKLKIAEIGLNVGDTLKYVYDFGDWIEHEISLESIEPSKAKTKYPRISEQNKPRYSYCEHCKAKGKKTIAVYICIDCSDEEQRKVMVCEDCLYSEHEDHYAEEIDY